MEKYKNLSQKELDYGFRWACQEGHLEIVKYLLTSPDLKEHADIHAFNDDGFRAACANGHLKVVKYLIFDMDIKKTYAIKEFFERW